MTAAKKAAPQPPESDPAPQPQTAAASEPGPAASDAPSGDLGKAEVAEKMNADLAQGYAGVKVDPIPDDAYSLQTGPTSPSSIPDATSRTVQHAFGAPDERKNV